MDDIHVLKGNRQFSETSLEFHLAFLDANEVARDAVFIGEHHKIFLINASRHFGLPRQATVPFPDTN